MIAVLLLALVQFMAAMLAIAMFLLIARQVSGDLVQSGAVWGVFVRPWWVYLIASSLLAALTLYLTFALMDAVVAGTLAKLGPAGTVFLLPILVFIFTYPLGGIAQWLIGLAKR